MPKRKTRLQKFLPEKHSFYMTVTPVTFGLFPDFVTQKTRIL